MTPLTDDEIALLSPVEAAHYHGLLEEFLARRSPLDLAAIIWPETRRWPQLILINEHLVALSEYRLTADGPVPASYVHWWYVPAPSNSQSGERVYIVSPQEIPEDADAYGADSVRPGALRSTGIPIVFDLALSMMPRGGKSRLTTEAFPLWCRLLDPNSLVGVGTYADNFGEAWGAQIRDLCVSLAEKMPWLPQPEGGPRGAAAHFRDTRGTGSTRYVGVGGGINGKSLHVLVGDDWLKNNEDAQSETVRKSVNSFLDTVWVKRKTRDLRPGARFPIPISVTTTTRWHRRDPIGHLTEAEETGDRLPGWCVLNIPALSRGEGDPLLRPEGASFPNAAGLSRVALLALQEDDPQTFAALYQGDPRPEGGGLLSSEFRHYWHPGKEGATGGTAKEDGYRIGSERHLASFKTEDGETVTVPLDECVIFAAADVAGTKKTSSDYSVMGVFAHNRKENVTFVLHWYRGRVSTDEYLETFLPILEAYNVRRVAIENVTYGQTLGQSLSVKHYGVDYYPTSADKVSRAVSSDISRMVRQGRMLLPMTAMSSYEKALASEVADFPYGAHDDQVDVLAAAGWFITTQVPMYREAGKRKPRGFSSLEEEIDAHAEKAAKRARKPRRDLWSAIPSR